MPQQLFEKLSRMAKQKIEWKERYVKTEIPFKEHETVFLPLRHFNSSTPITPGPYQSIPYNIANRPLQSVYGGETKLQPVLIGGGYYLFHKGKGVAIDPGYEFVDILHRNFRLTVHHIDTVVITHDHMDHHADLETIINLRRGAPSKLKIVANQEVIAAYGLAERQLVDGINIEVFPVNPGEDELVSLVKDVKARILPCMHCQRIRKLEPKSKKKGGGLDTLKLLKGHFNAFGLQLIIETKDAPKRILITGDTLFPVKSINNTWSVYGTGDSPYLDDDHGSQLGWKKTQSNNDKQALNSAIEQQCERMISVYKSLEKSDIVCLHLGSIEKGFANANLNVNSKKTSPLNAILGKIHDPQLCYPGFHLGIMGSLRVLELLIKNSKGFDPEKGLIVLTEFGEELLGNRQNLCYILSQLVSLMQNSKENHSAILPSEVTLDIRLHSSNSDFPLGVQCSYCNGFHDWHETIGEEGPGEIIHYVVKGASKGLHPNCSFSQ